MLGHDPSAEASVRDHEKFLACFGFDVLLVGITLLTTLIATQGVWIAGRSPTQRPGLQWPRCLLLWACLKVPSPMGGTLNATELATFLTQ